MEVKTVLPTVRKAVVVGYRQSNLGHQPPRSSDQTFLLPLPVALDFEHLQHRSPSASRKAQTTFPPPAPSPPLSSPVIHLLSPCLVYGPYSDSTVLLIRHHYQPPWLTPAVAFILPCTLLL